MDNDQILYHYKCGQCAYAGRIHLSGDYHDGSPHECMQCGGKVFLEQDGGVAFDIDASTDPVSLAKSWREKHGYVGRGGVVIVFNGIADSWVYELRNAHHQRPGCIAVDEQGKTWTSIGGTEHGGALMWLPNDEIAG